MKLSGAARALLVILVIALAVRIAIAFAMPNQVWPDEIFQSLEQAHRVVFGRGVLPWEFRDATRSWLFPGALAAIMKSVSFVSSSPTVYLGACATVLSVLSLAPVWVAFRTAERPFGLRGAIIAAATCTLWYELVYFAPKALGEVVAGNILVIGVMLADRIRHTDRIAGAGPARSLVRGCAGLLALVAAMRMQLAPAAGIAFLVAVWRLPWRQRIDAAIVAALVVLAVGMLDWITWSYPFQSFVENFRTNIIEGKSHHFGVAPWTAYFAAYRDLWGVLGLVVLAIAAVGAVRVPLYAAIAAVIVITHVPIAHKEYRFLYPALELVIVLVGVGLASLVARIEQVRTANLAAAGAIAIVLAMSLQLANRYDDPGIHFGFVPANVKLRVDSLWRERRGTLVGTLVLGEDPTVCGVALVGVHWSNTGGYAYLHRDIPLLVVKNRATLEQLTPFANAILGRPDLPDPLGPYVRGECWNTACLFHRPGGCEPLPPALDVARAGPDN
ncbi:MAG: hypothetical protein JO257_37910 [Deltaproteobacteria bacterium]|nr:hypothetical protein [Deltaproteobacteria bacterium]